MGRPLLMMSSIRRYSRVAHTAQVYKCTLMYVKSRFWAPFNLICDFWGSRGEIKFKRALFGVLTYTYIHLYTWKCNYYCFIDEYWCICVHFVCL